MKKLFSLISSVILIVGTIMGCSATKPGEPGRLFSPPGTTTTFILVRHAERDDSGGPSALTSKGRQRAEDLVKAVGDKGITAIYSPNRARNRETVQPLADHLGINIQLIDETQLLNTRKFAGHFVRSAMAKHPGKVILWVGNKSPVGIWGGNLKEIHQRLGAQGRGPSRYSDLFIISVPDQGPVNSIRTSYGELSGRFDQ